MQFQISSRRENRERATWAIKIRVLGKFVGNIFALLIQKTTYLVR